MPLLTDIGYYSVVKAGLQDSVSPAILTVLTLFWLQLFWAGRHLRRFCWLGGIYLAGVYLFRCGQMLGLFDFLWRHKIVWDFIDTFMLIFALSALLIGIFLFRDWLKAKWGQDQQASRIDLGFLCPSDQSGTGPRPGSADRLGFGGIKRWRAVILSFLGGCLAVLLARAWDEHGSVWFILYDLSLPDDIAKAFLMVVVYGLVFIWPIVLFWGIFCRVRQTSFFRRHFPAILNKIRILASAVFIGYALGILKVYWNFFFQS